MTKTVLFASLNDDGLSQMAAAIFNLLSDGAKAHATSAGTEPANRVRTLVVAAMAELDRDLSSAMPQELTARLVQEASIVVVTGSAGIPFEHKRTHEEWSLDEPTGNSIESVRELRDAVRARVVDLLSRENCERVLPAAPCKRTRAEQLAFHEAGHAVLAARSSLLIGDVVTGAAAPSLLGDNGYEAWADVDLDTTKHEDLLLVAFAGECATAIAGGDADVSQIVVPPLGDDFKIAQAQFRALGLNVSDTRDPRVFYVLNVVIEALAADWAAVRAVAQALFLRGRLTCSDVIEIVAGHPQPDVDISQPNEE